MKDALPGDGLIGADEEGCGNEVAHVPVQQAPQGRLIGLAGIGGHVGALHVHWIFHPLALRGGAGDAPQGLSAVHPGNGGLGRGRGLAGRRRLGRGLAAGQAGVAVHPTVAGGICGHVVARFIRGGGGQLVLVAELLHHVTLLICCYVR